MCGLKSQAADLGCPASMDVSCIGGSKNKHKTYTTKPRHVRAATFSLLPNIVMTSGGQMPEKNSSNHTKQSTKKAFWPLLLLYLMIGFEILYMISPFALYYYSVYGEGLSFVSDIPTFAWLTRFFLPHIAKTASTFLNVLVGVGWALASIGMTAFCIGAGQIYYYKFTRKGAVTGGIYNLIRHPQYVSLAVCGFGLLLVWPRYLVLLSFITMLFAYYFLAKVGQFYASLESGHTTASTALKRLASFNSKNQFYRANRELGRVFKTEYILQFMSDPILRQRVRRGLLKGEEMHALARQVAYGKQGQLTARDLEAQKNSSSCLTLIMACIIYWQAKEFNRVLLKGDPDEANVDLSLLEHVSPIGWDNIILYGEYVLNQKLVEP
jgi:protein-S-isoprenylcysteine O-methyltransferase Ste14